MDRLKKFYTFDAELQGEFVEAIVGFKSRIVHQIRGHCMQTRSLPNAGKRFPAYFLNAMQFAINYVMYCLYCFCTRKIQISFIGVSYFWQVEYIRYMII